MTPLLSVLIPTIKSRATDLFQLVEKIERLASDYKPYVEVLWLGDNYSKSVGEKRNNLVQMATGKFCAFVDDDDDIAEQYFQKIVPVIAKHQYDIDVVSFKQDAVWNEEKSTVEFSVKHMPFGAWNHSGITQRYPWHVCAWKTAVARRGVFEHINVGEDAAWVAQVFGLAHREAHIPHVLHYYTHKDGMSEAYK